MKTLKTLTSGIAASAFLVISILFVIALVAWLGGYLGHYAARAALNGWDAA